MKKLHFGNYQSFFIIISILLFSPQVFGQVEITRNGQRYIEKGEVKKFEITFRHDEIRELVTDACGTYDPREFKCPNEKEEGHLLAGFAFIPNWKIEESNGDNYFQTIGMRVVVVLWKPSENCLSPEVILASFDNIGDALSHNILGQANLFLEKNLTPNNSVDFPMLSSLSTPEERSNAPSLTQLFDNTREFDIVFLPIETYHYLATGKDFYNSNLESQGITLRQTLVVANGTYKDNLGNNVIQGTETVRSLWFEPSPSPSENLTGQNRESGTVFRHGIHCPPYWRNDLAETFEKIVCENSPPQQSTSRKNKVAFGIHLGLNSFDKDILNPINKLLFELTFEYRLKVFKNNSGLSTEIQVGRYFVSTEDKFYGLNILLKYTQNFSDERVKIFVAGGGGLNDFQTTTNPGLTAKAGIKFRVAPNIYAGGAVQYHNINSTTDLFETPHMFSAKAGLTFYLR